MPYVQLSILSKASFERHSHMSNGDHFSPKYRTYLGQAVKYFRDIGTTNAGSLAPHATTQQLPSHLFSTTSSLPPLLLHFSSPSRQHHNLCFQLCILFFHSFQHRIISYRQLARRLVGHIFISIASTRRLSHSGCGNQQFFFVLSAR